MCSQTLD